MPTRSTRRLLYAEDNPVTRTVVTRELRELGYEVEIAEDGTQAAALLLDSPDPPRLAVLDWRMPGASGLEICRRVRTTSSPYYLYLIILSGKSDTVSRIQALLAGADDFVTKDSTSSLLKASLLGAERVLSYHENLQQQIESAVAAAPHAINDGTSAIVHRVSPTPAE